MSDLSDRYYLDDNMTVKDLMYSHVIVVHTYDKIRKATKLLLEHRFGVLPVLNKEDDVVGMLSAIDLLKALDVLLQEDKKK